MARTPLIKMLQRSFRIAFKASKKDIHITDEYIGQQLESHYTRRKFIGDVAKTTAFLTAGSLLLPSCEKNTVARSLDSTDDAFLLASKQKEKIIIVGGGIAGLNCAYQLKKKKIASTIYEGSNRTGGRMFTAENIMAQGLSTELGGEFVDSGHRDMIQLAKEFGFGLIDTTVSSTNGLINDAYFFNNQHYTETDVINAFLPVAATIQADIDALPNNITYNNPGSAIAIDNTSLAQYIQNLNCVSWLKELLTVAYVTEYGLDAAQQSTINFLFLFSTDTSSGFDIFGVSDERYKIAGGNQQIPTAIAQQLGAHVIKEHKLVELDKNNSGKYLLTFEKPNGSTVTEDADFAVLTMPFTLLREVDIKFQLPAWKKNAIDNLGYGTNAKLLLGVNQRVWNSQGYRGGCYTDESFQLGWDNSELQPGLSGGYTLYSGGANGVAVGNGSVQSQINLQLPGLNKVYPGVDQHLNGNMERMHWPSYPWTKASYACYKPGQWTTIAGAERKNIDKLFFAGEHCSIDFQGYMNGGAETGRKAAKEIFNLI